MLRYASWIANGALLALCCFLVARILTGVSAALLALPPEPAVATAATATPGKRRSWSDREAILTRNLFNASLLVPARPAPPPQQEEIEETELSLGLLGTISAPRSGLGWAAVWDAEKRETLVVQPGDELGGGRATVMRIERERALLSENGAIRELVLDEDGRFRPPKRLPPKKKRRTSKRRGRRPARR